MATPGGNKGAGGNKGGGGKGGISPALKAYLSSTSLITPPRQTINFAHALANAQTQGPLNALANQIAQTNKGTLASQKLTGGYFNQFGKSAQQGFQDTQAVGRDLQTQLQGIGANTQSALQGIGQDAQNAVQKYMPAGDQGLSSPAMQSLTAEIARQRGYASQYGQIGQTSGALQSANYSGMAAAEKGIGAIQGTQALGELARAGRLAVQPLNTQRATLDQTRGALFADELGKIHQQDITNQFTEQGLGNTAAGIAATSANEAANRAATTANEAANRRAAAFQAGLDRQARAKIEQTIQSGENTRSAAAIAARKAATAAKAKGTGGATPLPQSEQNTLFKGLREMTSLITAALGRGHTQAQIKNALVNGTFQSNFAAQDIVLVNAAFELLNGGHVWPTTAKAMRSMGLRGGMWNGAPIRVGPPPNPALVQPGTHIPGAQAGVRTS